MQISPIDNLPGYTSKAELPVALLKALKMKLKRGPIVRQINQLMGTGYETFETLTNPQIQLKSSVQVIF